MPLMSVALLEGAGATRVPAPCDPRQDGWRDQEVHGEFYRKFRFAQLVPSARKGPTKTLRATDQKSGVTLKGRLDALVRTADGKYHIVDYKTAYPREEVPDYHQLQLDGYAFLLERNGYRPVAGGVLLHFMPEHGDLTEGRFPFEITPVRVAVNPSRIPRILFRAKRILEMESPPTPSKDCDMCRWRRDVEETLSR